MAQRDQPAPDAIRAVLRLLADDDPAIVEACRRQLLDWGSRALPALLEATRSGDAKLRVRSRAALSDWHFDRWSRRIEGLCARGWLDEGLVAVAQLSDVARLRAAVDVARVDAQLNVLAGEIRPLVAGRTSTTAARRLASVLAIEYGFDGSRTGYYSADNARIDRVLERRIGLPATLAGLYLVVGRRAGLTMTAVQLPEHFLVRVHGRRAVLLDPFHGGRTVTRADCLRFLRSTGSFDPEVARLADVDDSELLRGLLDNLACIHDGSPNAELRRALSRVREALAAVRRPTHSA